MPPGLQDVVPNNAKFLFYKRPGQRVILNYRGLLLVRPGPLESRLHLQLLCGAKCQCPIRRAMEVSAKWSCSVTWSRPNTMY